MNEKNCQAGLEALTRLLEEFRKGNIANTQTDIEPVAHRRCLGELAQRWDESFGGFPECRIQCGSFKGVMRRGLRDEYLKEIIVQTLGSEGGDFEGATIVNPACVFGRHGRDVARSLSTLKVIATDIDPRSNWIYEHFVPQRTPANYKFKRDNIFEPTVEAEPVAVVFFGACGSLSDAAMDYAVQSGARYLICRTCCHDNVAQNTVIVKQPTALNRLFRFKNFIHSSVSRKKKGFFFSSEYSAQAYPRSKAAKELIGSDEFLQVARNTVDSDICRAIIDLDRYLRLTEQGYNVWYRGELFFAERVAAERTCNRED